MEVYDKNAVIGKKVNGVVYKAHHRDDQYILYLVFDDGSYMTLSAHEKIKTKIETGTMENVMSMDTDYDILLSSSMGKERT